MTFPEHLPGIWSTCSDWLGRGRGAGESGQRMGGGITVCLVVSLLSRQKSQRAAGKLVRFVACRFFRDGKKSLKRSEYLIYSNKVATLATLVRAIASIRMPPKLSHLSTNAVPPYQQSHLNTVGYHWTIGYIFMSGPVTFRKGATKGGQPCAKCLMSPLLPVAKSLHTRTNNFLLLCLLLQHVAC